MAVKLILRKLAAATYLKKLVVVSIGRVIVYPAPVHQLLGHESGLHADHLDGIATSELGAGRSMENGVVKTGHE